MRVVFVQRDLCLHFSALQNRVLTESVKNVSRFWYTLFLHASVLLFVRMLVICQFLVCFWP